MINVYIVRHGETDTNKDGKINGASTDLPLNQTGQLQAQALHESFDMSKIARVYSSPMKRAFQTAQIVNDGHCKIEVDERLQEIDYGDWDGLLADQVQAQYPQAFDDQGYLRDNYSDFCNGESYQHLSLRLSNFWQDLVTNNRDNSILVVCHGTVSRSLVQTVLGIPDISQVMQVRNAGVISLAAEEQTGKAFLRYYNRVAPAEFFLR
ncbi:histidine phosphatase family protein [Bombilactobacillus bombi]|uniref:histidine phosphatase family protein n=1 Tax=Bombilactobacillus bombi TaxID=1303590 RepID=UPI0015E62055|nr:histidine phosphatase family protein [Bombilactobacillus bombi]MBA1392390.1 histidine phosphatase family protein [Lactobacillus sp. XV13L]MBA1433703.1 histidine phosphatase family protein [Bombilactobacillus bombi]